MTPQGCRPCFRRRGYGGQMGRKDDTVEEKCEPGGSEAKHFTVIDSGSSY
jgi:hypothetical protein